MYVDPNNEAFKEAISKYPFLQQYTAPLKKMERELVGREKEMRSLKAAFHRAELSNAILLAEAGSGKAIADTEWIPVADDRGYIHMGDIKVGDFVFDKAGEVTEVTKVFHHASKSAYLVTFTDGSEVICCDEHLWSVRALRSHNRNLNNWITVPLSELIARGFEDPLTHGCRWFIPVGGALQRNEYTSAVRSDFEAYGAAVAQSIRTGSEYALSDEDLEAFL